MLYPLSPLIKINKIDVSFWETAPSTLQSSYDQLTRISWLPPAMNQNLSATLLQPKLQMTQARAAQSCTESWRFYRHTNVRRMRGYRLILHGEIEWHLISSFTLIMSSEWLTPVHFLCHEQWLKTSWIDTLELQEKKIQLSVRCALGAVAIATSWQTQSNGPPPEWMNVWIFKRVGRRRYNLKIKHVWTSLSSEFSQFFPPSTAK